MVRDITAGLAELTAAGKSLASSVLQATPVFVQQIVEASIRTWEVHGKKAISLPACEYNTIQAWHGLHYM